MMVDVWTKFSAGLISTGITLSDKDIAEKKFPTFTICPWPAFRQRGLYFKEKDYLDNTFELFDVFNNISYGLLMNKSIYDWKELRGIYFGRCYTIEHKVTCA
jgi:hypothetical protein